MKSKLAAVCLMAAISTGCGLPDEHVESEQPAENTAAETDQTLRATPAAEPVRKPAGVGVGEKGRGYGTGPVATPIRAMFATQERLVFEVQIISGMKTYEALNGHCPETHEEFMKEIIEAGGIRLPKLPAGQRYVYDPNEVDLSEKNTGLMVEK